MPQHPNAFWMGKCLTKYSYNHDKTDWKHFIFLINISAPLWSKGTSAPTHIPLAGQNFCCIKHPIFDRISHHSLHNSMKQTKILLVYRLALVPKEDIDLSRKEESCNFPIERCIHVGVSDEIISHLLLAQPLIYMFVPFYQSIFLYQLASIDGNNNILSRYGNVNYVFFSQHFYLLPRSVTFWNTPLLLPSKPLLIKSIPNQEYINYQE